MQGIAIEQYGYCQYWVYFLLHGWDKWRKRLCIISSNRWH